MYTIEHEIFDYGYQSSLKLLLDKGTIVEPRGLKTIELSPFCFTLKNPRNRIIYNEVRNINLGFNILEFLSMVIGDDRVEMLAALTPNIKQFSDDGKVFRGAYGPRLRSLSYMDKWELKLSDTPIEYKIDQFQEVIHKLKTDKDSRQAIMTIFDPTKDYVKTKDVPCTVMFHFMIRDNKLNMNVYMRSNDAMLGHVIDVFSFTMIQELIANELNCELGEYNHIAGSFHLYEKDIEKAKRIIDNVNFDTYEMPKMIGGLNNAEETFKSFDDLFHPEKYINIFKERKLNPYWNDLLLVMKYQLQIKRKETDKVDLKQFHSEIYKKYFERKLYGKASF